MNMLSVRWLRFMVYVLCIGFLAGCTSQKTIINGLDERDANEIIVFLASKGIDSQKIRAKSEGPGGGGAVLWNIVVDSKNATDAMAILNSVGLPRKKSQKLLEIFTSGGLVPSEMQEKIRYQSGLSEQIASTVRKIDGIVDADVQLSFPETDPLNPTKTLGKVTASVFVKHTGILDDPNSHLITKIRRLVASSVQGLEYDNVTVIPVRAQLSSTQASTTRERAGVDLVRVWTVSVAQDSKGRFQLIFSAAFLLIFLLSVCVGWLIYRLMPLIREQGIIPALFSRKSFTVQKDEPPKEAKKEKEGGEQKPDKVKKEVKKEQKPSQENIEE